MSRQFIISLDQGTTSSRALLVDHDGTIQGMVQKEFKQIFPKSGWVEHDPKEILDSQMMVLKELLEKEVSLQKLWALVLPTKGKLLWFGIKIPENLFIMPLFGKINVQLIFANILKNPVLRSM